MIDLLIWLPPLKACDLNHRPGLRSSTKKVMVTWTLTPSMDNCLHPPKIVINQLDTITVSGPQIVLLYDHVIRPQIILLSIYVALFIISTPQLHTKHNELPAAQIQHKSAKQLGGAISSSNPKIIDLSNVLDTTQPPKENARYPQQTQPKGILQVGVHLNIKCQWQPRQPLPIKRGDHPIEHIIPQASLPLIPMAAQQNQDDVLIFMTNFPAETVTTACFRELISHGEMTRDTILNMFLAVLCAGHNLTYLSTFFIHVLRRDQSWTQLTSWFAPTLESQTYSHPYHNTTQPILIPCHVLGTHWVGIVRRVCNGRVQFLYADDLNHAATELELKTLLKTFSPPSFYPDNALWIHCKSVTFSPHSNECGPRTLFALAAMALHPKPSSDILLPFMHPNLAQILRTWIGAALLTGQVSIPSWTVPHSGISLCNTSVPYYLFPWTGNHQYEAQRTKQHRKQSRRTRPRLPTLTPTNKPTQQERCTNPKANRPSAKAKTSKQGTQLTMYDVLKCQPPPPPEDYDHVWGHYPEGIDDQLTLRVVFVNPRGLKLHSDIFETQYSMGRCHSLGVGALCIAESNLNWGNLKATGKFHNMLKKIWRHSKVSKSYTKDDFQTENQPGGTVTMAVNHWTSRVIEHGEDPYGLGRWSYLVLRGKGGIKVLIVTAYRVCKQTVQSVGYKTSTAQQFRQLSKQFRAANEINDPIIRHQFVVDLQAWLEFKTTEGYMIILGMDANDPYNPSEGKFTPLDFQLTKPISTKGHDGTIETLVRTSGLIDPLLHQHPGTPPPPTYDRGNDRIDFIFVSSALLPYVTRSGIFPYNSLFMSDHRPSYIDIDSIGLFQETTQGIGLAQHRGLQMQDPRLVTQYTETLLEQVKYHNILQKADDLYILVQKGQWTAGHTVQYEKLDKLVTEAMRHAEKSISKKYSTTYQWSPHLKSAISTLTYWKLRLSQLKGKTISQHTLQKTFQHTKLDRNLRLPLPVEMVASHIREARAALRDAQKRHIELRAQHLEDLVSAIIAFRRPSLLEPGQEEKLEKRRKKELRRIQRKEALSRMHRKIGLTLRPQRASGGLSRVDVPKTRDLAPYPEGPDPKTWDGAWTSLNNPIEIAKHVCSANARQYNQAHRTPCGEEPLASYLGYKADTVGAKHLAEGIPLPPEIRDQLLPETQAIFSTLASLATSQNPTITPIITPDQFKSCYQVMDERTSSSPSGRHLGHYKAARLSEELTELHSTMMSIPLSAGFSPTRWQQIIDVMLEKQPGDHRIHRLRIVALQESDFNQCNRLAIGRPLQKLIETLGLAPDMQHGSRASKLCHSAVLNKQLTFEIHRYQKHPLVYIENDAVGCYDRIINPLVLIFLRILGLSPSAVSSLASTWEHTYHRIKTLYGISEEIYRNNPERLLYGPGQGSTIGPFLWLLCFILIFLSLGTTSPRIHLQTVNRASKISYVGEAFVDDAGLGTNEGSSDYKHLTNNLQTLAQRWEKLLFSTGGALNLSKCFWFLLSWQWVKGKPVLHTTVTAPGDLIMTSESNPAPVTIPRVEPTSSFRTLGVHISPSGTNTGALKILRGIVLEYCTMVTGSTFTRQEALTSYIQYLLPKLRFQPPLLSLAQSDCDKLTSMILQALLPKLHINRNTARSIVFGGESYGGLALPNLYVTQGIDKLRLFLGHLRINDRTGKLIQIDMSFIQLLTGSGKLFLNQDEGRYTWLEAGWLQSLWHFTSRYSLEFLYLDGWLPSKPRQRDHFLMELFQKHKPPVKVMRTLNRCRLYLQVLTLSDITTADGTAILKEAKLGQPLSDRRSKLLWPAQGLPPRQDWVVWRQYLGYLEERGKLIVPLGLWITTTHQEWRYGLDRSTNIVYDFFQRPPLLYHPLVASRTLRSGPWFRSDNGVPCNRATPEVTTTPISIQSQPSTDGSLFRLLVGPNPIPTTGDLPPNIKGRIYYEQLLPKEPPIPIADILSSDTLHICVSGTVNKDTNSSTSSWWFTSSSVDYSAGHTIRGVCSPYRTTLRSLLTALYVLYQAEQGHTSDTLPLITVQCGHKKVLKEAFRTTPIGVTTANQAEYDLILDIRHLRHLLRSRIQHCHSTTPPTDIQPPVQDLVLSIDYIADATLANHQLANDSSPLSHVISVFHRGTALTGDIRTAISTLEYNDPIQQKLKKDNQWTDQQLTLIDWKAFHMAFSRVPRSHRISITKLSHQLWNTNCQNNKYYGQSAACPICQHPNETIAHIFRCSHEDATSHREGALEVLSTNIKNGSPHILHEVIMSGIQQWIAAGTSNLTSPMNGSRLPSFQILNAAFEAQSYIGWEAFHRGHLTHLWREAFRQHHRPKRELSPSQLLAVEERWVRLLITSVWAYSEKLWQFRNKVVHGHTESFKISKATRQLHNTVRDLYAQFTSDPFMLPATRRYLFHRPLQDTLCLDWESLKAWTRSVREGVLTQDHRDRLASAALNKTLHRFFNKGTYTINTQVAKHSWWKAPFSANYYRRVFQNLHMAEGRSSLVFRNKKGSLSGKGVTVTRTAKCTRRTVKDKRCRTLLQYGFSKVTLAHRSSHAPVGEKEFSGTRLSTAP